MEFLLPSLLLIAGLVGLSYGAEYLVRGAVSISRLLGISPFIIGMTIVAWGTSAPEVVVTVSAILGDAEGVAIGNVVGSNITNVLLIGGVAALMIPLCCAAGPIRRDGSILILVTLFVGLLAYTFGYLPLWAGIILLLGMIAHTVFLFWTGGEDDAEEMPDVAYTTPIAMLALLGGLAVLIIGGQFFIMGAVDLAELLHVPEAIVGATIVAIGTSLPELFASIAAARQGHRDVVIGNILGSNLTNILLVLGLAAVMDRIAIPPELFHMSMVLFVATSVGFVAWLSLGRSIGRVGGVVLLVLFAAYLLWSFEAGMYQGFEFHDD